MNVALLLMLAIAYLIAMPILSVNIQAKAWFIMAICSWIADIFLVGYLIELVR